VERAWTPQSVAEEMKAAQDRCRQIPPFTSRLAGFAGDAAYEVARLIHEARVAEGATPVGRKIGFTNRNIWAEYGVYEPIWAHVYDTTVSRLSNSTGACALTRFADPRIEPEIVFHFKSAPPVTDSPSEILRCVDWIAHGIEIVQSHFPDWRFQAADTVADSSLHATLMVGEPRGMEQLGPDLVARLEMFTIALSCNGVERDRGGGANVLGSPLAAIAHLIGVLARQPGSQPLQAGELVTTGTLTRALPIRAGETWTTQLYGLELPGISLLAQ
jgi:2-keto-4-pentenoate hydratase